MRIRLVSAILGRFLCGLSVFMSIPAVWAAVNADSRLGIIAAALVTAISGGLMIACGSHDYTVGVREGLAVVSGAWILTSLYGALPFLFTGATPTYIDALFETVSGLTTTGATVINSLSDIPEAILLWRSMTHWLGGMGIIVAFIVFLPQLGVGAFQLFKAEVPGPITEKVMPRIRDTALALWTIYLLLTIFETILLMLAGMTFFDALNHAFATVATGGFSTKDSSIKYYDNLFIEVITTIFMIIAGGNFALYYAAWRSGLKRLFADTELKVYLTIIAVSTLLIAANLVLSADLSLERSLRDSLFQVASIITTTGFVSADFDQWPPLSKMVILLLMFVGGCAGSTAGAIKVARVVILCKYSWAELQRTIHPKVVISIQIDKKIVDAATVSGVFLFIFVYLITFGLGVLLMTATGMQTFDAIGAVASSVGNVGPGFGMVGPATTYAAVSPAGKLILSLCMLLGRLEFVTLLVFLRAEFWRSQKGW